MGIVLVIVPWMLVSFIGGQALIYINIASLAILLFFRKKIYLLLERIQPRYVMTANMIVASLALSLLIMFPEDNTLFIVIMFISQIYIYFYYVTRAILTKEIVTDSNYGKYNGILEIENQAATFISGGLAAYLINRHENILNEIVVFSISGLLVSAFLLITKIKPPQSKDVPLDDGGMRPPVQVKLALIAIGASATFICVKLLDVINPIYVVEILNESPDIIAISGVSYTIGAIGAGLLGATQAVKAYEFETILLSLVGFLSFCVIFTLLTSIELFYISWCAFGLFNGLSRISWQTIAMNALEKSTLSSFFASITMLVDVIRIALLLVYSLGVAYLDSALSFLYLSVVCAIGTCLCLMGRKRLAII
jgi:hypothetical protein